MDQIRIGKFISEKRKQKKMTQMQLAEKLGVTDRAVSKWETGKSMPDYSIIFDLCALLGISVNDLLCGEEISMEKYSEQTEKLLLDMVKQKEEADKRLLVMECVIGGISLSFMFAMIIIASIIEMPDFARIILIATGFVQFIVAMMFALRIEQVAGYYKCAHCGHTYVPTYKSVNLAMHMGRTRFMKCPECGKKSWQKKVINKE